MEAQATLDGLTGDEFGSPDAMNYFYELFRHGFTEEQTGEETRPIIGTMCVQVPDELILAAGGRPLRLCSGANTFAQLGADHLPAKSCPLVKATVGQFRAGIRFANERLKAVVISGLCEQKRKAAELLVADGIPVYALEAPATKDSEISRFYWQESVRRFAADLEGMCGTKITVKGLKKAMALTAAASGEYRRLHTFLAMSPSLISGCDALLVSNAYFLDDIERWTAATACLNDELEERKDSGYSITSRLAPRLLLTGSPILFPNMKIPLLAEQAGGIIVADELCSSDRLLYDIPHYNEERLYDMVPALADRILKPCTCPCLSPNNDRKRRILGLVKSHAVDGVIYQSLSGCLPYELEQHQINTLLAESRIPMLSLETDYSPEDQGQLSTRVEAFLESIKARGRNKT